MYRVGVILGLSGLALMATQAAAEDVVFGGTLTNVCTLALSQPGTLGLAGDGTLNTVAGSPAQLTVLSVGTNSLTINNPTFSKVPMGYQSTGQALKVGYSGLTMGGAADQALTTSTTARTITTIPATAMTVHAEASNTVTGFPPGTYELRVVVTCS